MSIKEVVATAADIAKSETVQKEAAAALSMLFPYAGLKKKAVDVYVHDIEASDMSPESKAFAILTVKKTFKKIVNQQTIAEIAQDEAAPGTDFSSSCGVNEEWLERYMDAAGFVSEEQVQEMWGKVLSKEFEEPGSTPRSMIRILTEISPHLARAFQFICSMQVILVDVAGLSEGADYREEIVVPYYNEQFISSIGLRFKDLNELETLGLIKFGSVSGYVLKNVEGTDYLVYTNGVTWETCEIDNDELPVGNVLLTDAGECFQKITPTIDVPGYHKVIKEYLESQKVKFKESSGYSVRRTDAGNILVETIDSNSENE